MRRGTSGVMSLSRGMVREVVVVVPVGRLYYTEQDGKIEVICALRLVIRVTEDVGGVEGQGTVGCTRFLS